MTTIDVPSEVEGKLLIPTERGRRVLSRLERIGAYALRPLDVQRLHSIYLDTADFALARQSIALRLRRAGKCWEATAKWSGRSEGAVHERPELTVPLPGRPQLPFTLPDGALRRALTVHVMGRPLNPILITDVHRRRSHVLPAGRAEAAPIAEIALDRVTLRPPQGGGALGGYCEIEIEGTPQTLTEVQDITEILRREHDLTPSTLTKFASGMRLLHGEGEVRAEEPEPVRPDDSVAIAARKIVARQLQRIKEHDPGTRRGDDPESLHSMRVATRRLRAAVRAFAATMPEQLRAQLLDDLRWLGRSLGGVRDLDVQLANLDQYSLPLPAAYRAALDPLRRHLADESARRRSTMVAGLDSPRYFRLLVKLERFASSRPRPERLPEAARRPIGPFAGAAIEHAWNRLLKRGQRIGDVSSPEDLHPLRIRSKRLRYLLEFLSELTGKPGRRLVKQLVMLQDQLGALNDSTVTAGFVCAFLDAHGSEAAPSTHLAVQEFAQAGLRRSQSLRASFAESWRRFRSKRTRKKVRALLERFSEPAAAAR